MRQPYPRRFEGSSHATSREQRTSPSSTAARGTWGSSRVHLEVSTFATATQRKRPTQPVSCSSPRPSPPPHPGCCGARPTQLISTRQTAYDGNASDQLRLYARSRGASGSRDHANSRCRPLPPATAKPEVLVNVSSILTAAMDGALSTAHNRGKHDAAHAGSRSSTNRSSSSSKSSNTHVAAGPQRALPQPRPQPPGEEASSGSDMWSNTRNISVAAHHERRADGDLAPPDCLHFCMWLGIDEAVLAAVAWAAALEHPVPVHVGALLTVVHYCSHTNRALPDLVRVGISATDRSWARGRAPSFAHRKHWHIYIEDGPASLHAFRD